MTLEQDMQDQIMTALKSGKLDAGFTSDFTDILHNQDEKALDATVAYFAEGAAGIPHPGLEESTTERGLYIGRTTYRTLLALTDRTLLTRFIKPKGYSFTTAATSAPRTRS